MQVWGFDLGVRSWHAAALENGHLSLFKHVDVVKGKIRDQAPYERGRELVYAHDKVSRLEMSIWAQIFIEEPPLAGTKNLRTYLKLAQMSSAVAIGGAGRYTEYVPVDAWKKTVCGAGGQAGMNKAAVATWLSNEHPTFFEQCDGDQNYVDAVCIALYGLSRTTVDIRA